MAIGVKIDFSRTYAVRNVTGDLKILSFESALRNGHTIPLKVEIANESHALLPNVFNLAFGPTDAKGDINDKAELPHADYSRVFSTILFGALNYLKANPSHYLGIDGSDNNRAYYYWRFLQRNFNYLAQYFEMFGLKYYVRITRFGKLQYENPFDFDDIQPYPERLYKTSQWPPHMYNYFIFRLHPPEAEGT